MSWKAVHLSCRFLAALLWGLVLSHNGYASSLSYCQGQGEPSAEVQDRLLQVAAIVKAELDRSGESVALVARSGLALQRLNQRYSHAGVSLKDSPNAPWSVRQLYFACDEQRPRIFDQGLSGFVLGANDPSRGFISVVLLPQGHAQQIERTALDKSLALQLLGNNYSANAYAFSQLYQNCNQWLAELIALAWSERGNASNVRSEAQQWLQTQGYAPTVLRLGWQPLVWLAPHLPWLHTDDHPPEDLAAAQFRVSMPESIETFVRARAPDARRMELCYTESQVVLRRGWDAIAADCVPALGDEVFLLSSAQVQ